MIKYDSANLSTLLRWRGSVFPKASKYALVVSIAAMVLKICEENGWMDLHEVKFITNSAAFSGFQFVLSFVIVFRASQCYTRFCQCAGSVCELRSQLAEAASSLITFTIMSKKPAEETDKFKHLLIRLFSLLHATALEVIAEQQHQNLPVIDIHGINANVMKTLEKKRGKDKVDTVYQWINIIIIQNLENGLLNIPPPILSRVFQELEKGMVSYNQVLQIMAIPFPFPYAQTTMVLSVFYLCLLPFIMMQWAQTPVFAFICTYVSVVSVLSIEFTATELENPFGDDANDLPCKAFQDEMNSSLLVLLDPHACVPPTLNDSAIVNYGKLTRAPYDFFGSGTESATLSEDPQGLEQGPAKTVDQILAMPAESLEQEPLPRMPQQSYPPSKTGSLEARLGAVPGKARPSDLQVKVGPNKEGTSASTSVSTSAPTCANLPSDTTWYEKFAQDQRTAQQEMLQTLVGILRRLDQPLSVSGNSASPHESLSI